MLSEVNAGSLITSRTVIRFQRQLHRKMFHVCRLLRIRRRAYSHLLVSTYYFTTIFIICFMFSNLMAAIGVEVGTLRKLIRYTMQQIKRHIPRNVTDTLIMRSFPALCTNDAYTISDFESRFRLRLLVRNLVAHRKRAMSFGVSIQSAFLFTFLCSVGHESNARHHFLEFRSSPVLI